MSFFIKHNVKQKLVICIIITMFVLTNFNTKQNENKV